MFQSPPILIRKFSTVFRQANEIKIPVSWGQISGKWWEPTNKQPILVIHGGQDNCGSFDRLIPLLNQDVGFLAIDLPGHGYSSRYPPGVFYNNMTYPILFRALMKYFGWKKIRLMGHSFGAISCYTFSMLFPEDVDFLVLIDVIKPLEKLKNEPRMAMGSEEFWKFAKHASDTNESPAYDLEYVKQKVCESNNNSIDYKYCDIILKRNLVQSTEDPSKYYITRDPRIKSSLMSNWDQDVILEYGKAIKFPLLLLKATKSGYFERKENFYELLEVLKKSSIDCQFHYVEGTHHIHLNTPELIRDHINHFLSKYYKNNQNNAINIDDIKV